MLKPREPIAGLSPYRSPILSRDGLSLDLNESMAGCSPRVLARLRSLSFAEVSLYPEREIGERLIANFLGIAPEQVLLTNGMDEALSLLFATYLGSNDKGASDELLFAGRGAGGASGAPAVGRRPGASRCRFAGSHFAAHPGDRDRESQQSHRLGGSERGLAEDRRIGA